MTPADPHLTRKTGGTDVSEIGKASAEAVEAARQGDQFAVIVAALQAQHIINAQQAPAPPAPIVIQKSGAGQAGKWLAIAVGGSMLMVTVAFAAVALAIAAACIALVALVVYGIYRDIRGRK
ncbi:hypothetical protein [Actinacidiphila acidipaludis]|uniref:Uncharacterized protein n=1 Tax=Actinacidiphila acidipaludis TaxID=2873382 RepID=A0ABS7Q0Y2_9ACTN|nr:hypothetical protein [Streptomyces acidipaludis]MBY8876804.1 hypothetical protein [Streptomyces acidipaludis]